MGASLQSIVFMCAGENTYRSKWCPAKGKVSFLVYVLSKKDVNCIFENSSWRQRRRKTML
jgi:hypothetical protein